MYPQVRPLAQVLAQLVTFARSDYDPRQAEDAMPQDVLWNISYICSCFLAQHTVLGDGGVDTEFGFASMKVDEDMSFEERIKLAEAAIEELGGIKK